MRAHLLAVAAKDADDGLSRCRVLWNAAGSPSFLASSRPCRRCEGFAGPDQESVYTAASLQELLRPTPVPPV